MKVIQAEKSWFSSILEQQKIKFPKIKGNVVLIKVWAVGVNRDDVYDVATSANGFCPGLECFGIIEAVGRTVDCFQVGERVCAILEGGGYVEQVAVAAEFVLPLPDDIDLDDVAGLPYASCCIWFALFKMHTPEKLKDKSILIHEGFNGIGLLAIQYAKHMGLKVIASRGKSDSSTNYDYYGADFCVDHTLPNFESDVLRSTNYRANIAPIFLSKFYAWWHENFQAFLPNRNCVDIVLDYGAGELQKNIYCCCNGGKVAIVDFGGVKYGSVDRGKLQQRHAEIKVFNLRCRDFQCKASVVDGLKTRLWPAILQQKVVPATHHYFSVSEAEKAFDLVKKNASIGKIIVRMDFDKAIHLKTL